MKVLVTGGAGFIGSHVVDRLLAAGVSARVFDVRPSPYHGDHEVEGFVGDILDRRALPRAMDSCDAVAHLAAVADVDQVAKQPAHADEVNTRGTLNVLESAREAGVPRVLYASTVWVYPAAAGELDEDAGLGLPTHFYAATKLAGEMYCRSYAELYGLEYTLLRFGIPYGPRARSEAVIPTFVSRALAGQPLTIAGDGRQSRRFVYVEDLAEGVVRALAPIAANRVYNLVGDERTSIREIADMVRREVREVEIVHADGRTGDFRGAEISARRAQLELGWTAVTPFADGLRHYVAWWRAEHERATTARPEPAGAGRRLFASQRRGRPSPHALSAASMGALPLRVLAVLALVLGTVVALAISSGALADPAVDALGAGVRLLPSVLDRIVLTVVAVLAIAGVVVARRALRDRPKSSG